MSTQSERVGVVDELLQIQDDGSLGQGQRRGTVNFGPASQSAESASTPTGPPTNELFKRRTEGAFMTFCSSFGRGTASFERQ